MTTNENTEHPVKVQAFERNLKCELSKDELVIKGRRAAVIAEQAELIKAELEAQKKQAKARLEECSAEVARLNSEIREGAVWRGVPCETRFIYRTGEVQEVRRDTGEVLSVRAMTASERQVELPFEPESTPHGGEDSFPTALPPEVVAPYSWDGEPELPTKKKKGGKKKTKTAPISPWDNGGEET